jgi:hypothetical protein
VTNHWTGTAGSAAAEAGLTVPEPFEESVERLRAEGRTVVLVGWAGAVREWSPTPCACAARGLLLGAPVVLPQHQEQPGLASVVMVESSAWRVGPNRAHCRPP